VATTPVSATIGGNVTANGGAEVISRGVCWNTIGNPSTSDKKTIDGGGTGAFSSVLSELLPGTLYYVRAYASNLAGTAYGEVIILNTKIADIEGNTYKTVTIGTQIWMAENLKATKYRNGDIISSTTPPELDISGETEPKYQWAYFGDGYNIPIYGRLYTGYAALDVRNLCPAGWNLPSDGEFTILVNYLGGDTIAGGKLKEAGYDHWSRYNKSGTNESGFTALPGGYRSGDGYFGGLLYEAAWWCSTGVSSDWGWGLGVRDSFGDVYLGSNSRQTGLSVRCLKDY